MNKKKIIKTVIGAGALTTVLTPAAISVKQIKNKITPQDINQDIFNTFFTGTTTSGEIKREFWEQLFTVNQFSTQLPTIQLIENISFENLIIAPVVDTNIFTLAFTDVSFVYTTFWDNQTQTGIPLTSFSFNITAIGNNNFVISSAATELQLDTALPNPSTDNELYNAWFFQYFLSNVFELHETLPTNELRTYTNNSTEETEIGMLVNFSSFTARFNELRDLIREYRLPMTVSKFEIRLNNYKTDGSQTGGEYVDLVEEPNIVLAKLNLSNTVENEITIGRREISFKDAGKIFYSLAGHSTEFFLQWATTPTTLPAIPSEPTLQADIRTDLTGTAEGTTILDSVVPLIFSVPENYDLAWYSNFSFSGYEIIADPLFYLHQNITFETLSFSFNNGNFEDNFTFDNFTISVVSTVFEEFSNASSLNVLPALTNIPTESSVENLFEKVIAIGNNLILPPEYFTNTSEEYVVSRELVKGLLNWNRSSLQFEDITTIVWSSGFLNEKNTEIPNDRDSYNLFTYDSTNGTGNITSLSATINNQRYEINDPSFRDSFATTTTNENGINFSIDPIGQRPTDTQEIIRTVAISVAAVIGTILTAGILGIVLWKIKKKKTGKSKPTI